MNYLKNIKSPDDLKKIDIDKLPIIAKEIREKIIDVVSTNGGHIAPSLGTVDLTIALHYVFNCPLDKIVWDVGHQSYAHKLLTGRFDRFHTLRTYKGISGFPNKYESPYDVFTVGHSSTAISQALALACSRDLNKTNEKILAVVGDGSLTGGMAFEALNNAGHMKKDLIVVLNDNEMAISKTVGALSEYLNRIITMPIYSKVKNEIRGLIKKLPANFSERVLYTVEKLEESLKGLLVPGMLFEELGFFYIGPIDGHNLPNLIESFKNIKRFDCPVLIHVLTKKGKGYKHSEEEPSDFHGVGPFDKENGNTKGKVITEDKSYTKVFSETILELAKKDKKIVTITAAMPVGVGLDRFAQKYSDRFFDVGIAEGHAVTFSGGLAVSGYKPVIAVYSTFLQRAYDQIIHDVCLQNAPVIFAIDRTGLVGQDGATHHGVFTIAYLRHIPNISIIFPINEFEMKQAFQLALKQEQPFAICYPRSNIFSFDDKTEQNNLELGKLDIVYDGNDIAILTLGSLVYDAADAVSMLKKEGIDACLANIRFVKPFDVEGVLKIANKFKNILVIEEGVLSGGLGSLVLETLNKNNMFDINVQCLGIPDEFIEHGARDILLKNLGLDAEGIFVSAKKMVENGCVLT